MLPACVYRGDMPKRKKKRHILASMVNSVAGTKILSDGHSSEPDVDDPEAALEYAFRHLQKPCTISMYSAVQRCEGVLIALQNIKVTTALSIRSATAASVRREKEYGVSWSPWAATRASG